MGRGNAKKAGKKKADKTPRPRKKPANIRKEAKKKEAAKRKKKRTAKARLASSTAAAPTASTAATAMSAARSADPSATEDAEARFIQPYQATKPYRCPACNQAIAVGVGHMVSVPPEDPELRRHWHRGCWNNRHNLR